jgi:hypothetical protein
MVFITGDTHASFHRFSTHLFKEQVNMTRDDIVIICGDFGGIWRDCPEERYWLNWLAEKPFTICYVDGNHENFDRYYGGEFPVVDFFGGKAHKVRDNIYHLMRGYVFEFEGKKFFAFGGASSHDIDDGILDRNDFDSEEEYKETWKQWDKARKMFRINHLSWWKEEMPSQEEMDFGLKTLEQHNFEVDYVISHCAPQEVCFFVGGGLYKPDELTIYFNDIAHKLKFKRWDFGHYHDTMTVFSKFHMHYYDIERIL